MNHTCLIVITVGFTIGFAAVGAASFLHPEPRLIKSGFMTNQTVAAADLKPVRLVGTPFVPNIHPRER
jgi:hypothetical protein